MGFDGFDGGWQFQEIVSWSTRTLCNGSCTDACCVSFIGGSFGRPSRLFLLGFPLPSTPLIFIFNYFLSLFPLNTISNFAAEDACRRFVNIWDQTRPGSSREVMFVVFLIVLRLAHASSLGMIVPSDRGNSILMSLRSLTAPILSEAHPGCMCQSACLCTGCQLHVIHVFVIRLNSASSTARD